MSDRATFLAERATGIGSCKNRYEIRGDSSVIILDTQKGPVEAVIDTSDLALVLSAPFKWSAAYDKRHDTWYAQFITARPNRRTISLHRFITSAPAGFEVDHWDHDGLNNRRSNLKVVTTSVNQLNRRGPSSRSKTGILGVSWNVAHRKFRAQVRIAGKEHYLGGFSTKEEAADALRKFREERGISCQL